MYKSSISVKKELIIHLIFWLIWMYYSLIIIGDHGFQVVDVDLFYGTGMVVYVITFYLHYCLSYHGFLNRSNGRRQSWAF